MTQTNPVVTVMTFEEYTETLANEGWLSTYFAERYWDGGLDTDRCFEIITESAILSGVFISDIETVDYDTLLSDWYRDTEKL